MAVLHYYFCDKTLLLLLLVILLQVHVICCGLTKNSINNSPMSMATTNQSVYEDNNGCQQIECLPPILAPKLMKVFVGLKKPPLVLPQNYPRLLEEHSNGHAQLCLCLFHKRKVSFNLSPCGRSRRSFCVTFTLFWDQDELKPTIGQARNCSRNRFNDSHVDGIITNGIFYGEVYYGRQSYQIMNAKAIFNETEIAHQQNGGGFHSILF